LTHLLNDSRMVRALDDFSAVCASFGVIPWTNGNVKTLSTVGYVR
jgi:hypothetical protein